MTLEDWEPREQLLFKSSKFLMIKIELLRNQMESGLILQMTPLII